MFKCDEMARLKSLSSRNDLALQALDRKYRDLAPPFVYKSSILMNCAYANLLSRIVKVKYFREWKKSEFYEESLALAKILDIENGWAAESDMDAVNRWAEWMRLSDWFKWHPFEEVPLRYYDIDH
jgi:hypothetical protein